MFFFAESFVDQLKSVASDVTAMKSSKQVSKKVASQSQIKTESVDAKVNGKIKIFYLILLAFSK